jgi:formyl-CoA transferase
MPAQASSGATSTALDGIRVLDIGTMIAGPMVATLLGDFGAEVIKVELPGSGDPMRYVGARVQEESLAWLIAGRNKKSVTLDVRRDEGRRLFLRLLEHADVLVENFRPGTLERWNLGEDELRAVRPDLVFLRISGYGQTGPRAARPGFDGIALAYSGVMYITGHPSAPPSRVGVALADYSTGYNGAFATMLALFHRDRHGGGQTIDLSLYETAFGMTRELVPHYELTGEVRERVGNSNPQIAPGGLFLTSDEAWLMIAGSSDNTWQRLATAIGRTDLADDPRFRSNTDRIANADVLNELLSEWVRAHRAEDVLRTLEEHDVPASRVFSVKDIAEDEHYAASNALVEVEHQVLGRLRIPGIPARLSRTPGTIRELGPDVGQHNSEVYGELLGLTEKELEDLRGATVI